jgi:tRNA G37 N-methylase Trm5
MRIPFDIIGSKEKSVAIITDPKLKNAKKAAIEIMKKHKSVKSVLQKAGGRQTEYRLYDCRLVAGDKNTEVLHKEYGYLLNLDPQRVYFSPRESEERRRMAEMVGDRERVLVMFSGVAPLAVAIAKKHPSAEITCLDINLDAIRYANRNVKLNGLNNVKNYCWDVREAPGLGKFDRILMPLPESALDYLDAAFACSKKGTIIHLYAISDVSFKDLLENLKHLSHVYNVRFEVLDKQLVLPYAPRLYKVRVDLKVI